MDCIELAKTAFYGTNEPLMDAVSDALGYEMDGCWYPANGLSLGEVINYFESLSEREWAAYESAGLIELAATT